jgi:hypothetical protein
LRLIGPDDSDRRKHFVGTSLRLWMPGDRESSSGHRKTQPSDETTFSFALAIAKSEARTGTLTITNIAVNRRTSVIVDASRRTPRNVQRPFCGPMPVIIESIVALAKTKIAIGLQTGALGGAAPADQGRRTRPS